MSKALFKNTLIQNWKLFLIFFTVLCTYLVIIISLINPQDMEKIKELFGAMGGFLSAFGISIDAMTNPLSYTASVFFGILVMGFSMVFYIIQVNKLVAKSVEDNSLAYTLSMPISRTKFIITQAVYLCGSLMLLFIGILVTGSIALGLLGEFNFGAYANLVAITFLLNLVMALLSFLLSVAFCDSKKGISLASGVPIGFLLLSMLGGAVGDKVNWLGKISPFSWIDSVGIVNGTVSSWWMYLVFIIASAVLLVLTIIVFKNKKLPL